MFAMTENFGSPYVGTVHGEIALGFVSLAQSRFVVKTQGGVLS
ncbi:hypothetical protein RD1_3067 [Roseobacter denitrificans OCh 114]|uniref:Uncharacterized protein n=1 Tax=Roseobacter denitrificans (strain ATCC 33942 / OCh 114) TaxID=375451 RepID=Q164L4_ROSDO|nr:hypothetical protein RD1_3067 [Roseobacter denitrificans OCh 114]